jgi:cytochrome P450
MVATAMTPEHGTPGIPHLDFDPFSIEFFADPFPTHEKLREAGPVVYLNRWGVYGVARYEQVHAVLNDPLTFCSNRGVGLSDFVKEKPWRPPSLILEADPPAHTRTRAVLNQVLSATALKPLRGHFTALAEAKVDELLTRGSFVAVADLAESYPLSVFPDAMGLKQEGRENLLPYASLVFNAFGPPNQLRQRRSRRSAPSVYVAAQVPAPNLVPGGFGACIHARADAGEITHEEAPLLVRSLLSAGIGDRPAASAPLFIAWRAFPTSWRSCGAIRHWRAMHSRKPSAMRARCKPSFVPRRARSRSADTLSAKGRRC